MPENTKPAIMQHFERIFPSQTAENNLFLYLASSLHGLKRSSLERAFRQNLVEVNSLPASPDTQLSPGDKISVKLPGNGIISIFPEAIPLDILHEDEQIIVVNKPAGMPCHKGLGHYKGTLLNALAHHYQATGQQDVLENGLVHRLDKNTSGVMVLAKTSTAFQHLQEQFRLGYVRKKYYAVVEGHPCPAEAIVDIPIGRDPENPYRIKAFSEHEGGKPAVSRYKLIRYYDNSSLLECETLTGRTHQLRVHFSHLGHPLIGDARYGAGEENTRHMLHASSLSFLHPVSGERLSYESPLPGEFMAGKHQSQIC